MQRKHLLIIDNDPLFSAVLMKVFEDEGYLVELASDELSVMHKLEEVRYDVVILDVTMPEFAGRFIVQELLAFHFPRPVLCTCTYDTHISSYMRWRMHLLGIYDYFKKPFCLSRLVAHATELCQLYWWAL